jgi:glycosyltransferase involved in cell wall biosynthesis
MYNRPMSRTQPLRTALVHDWLNQAGGAEVVLEVMHGLFPDAPIYTALFDPARVPAATGWDVRPIWLDRLPQIHAHHQPYLPLYPVAWQMTQLSGYDLVLSNKSGFCHGVRTNGAVHVCYCLTPTRFVWQAGDYLAYEVVPTAARPALRLALPLLQRWDRAAATRVDHFIAISTTVRDRIRRFYGRDSAVIYPPVEVDRYRTSPEVGDYYLVLSRLVPYKRIDLAVAAFNRLGRRLLIVGDGRDRSRLQALAGPTIEFCGRLPDEAVTGLLARCRALIWPGVEDFGLAPVEAMASGRPVIARRAGGVLDTVVEGRTGVFFDHSDAAALAQAVQQADAIEWDPGAISRHAQHFGRAVFEARLTDFLRGALEQNHDHD